MMNPSSRIHIAGHTGLVGQGFVRRFRTDGMGKLLLRTHDELDLTDQAGVSRFYAEESPDLVIMAAAKVGGIHANAVYPAEFIYENLMIQNNMIHQAQVYGVSQLIFLGSTCAYPRLAPQPMREDSLLTGPLEPTNEPYAVAKIAGLKLCESYHRQYGMRCLMLMPTNLYGPHDNFHPENSHVIPGLMRRIHEAKLAEQPEVTIWGSGSTRREFLHVDDLVDACLYLLKQENSTGPINIGSGSEVSIRELAELMCEVIGYAGKLRFDANRPAGMPLKKVDTSRMDTLGWCSRILLKQGLESVYRWYLDNLPSLNLLTQAQIN